MLIRGSPNKQFKSNDSQYIKAVKQLYCNTFRSFYLRMDAGRSRRLGSNGRTNTGMLWHGCD